MEPIAGFIDGRIAAPVNKAGTAGHPPSLFVPPMLRTIGYHICLSAYGLWLPGDERGHWSEAWDEQLGYIEPHTLHAGDPIRKRTAQERMKHPPVRFSSEMISVTEETLGRCATESDWRIVRCFH